MKLFLVLLDLQERVGFFDEKLKEDEEYLINRLLQTKNDYPFLSVNEVITLCVYFIKMDKGIPLSDDEVMQLKYIQNKECDSNFPYMSKERKNVI